MQGIEPQIELKSCNVTQKMWVHGCDEDCVDSIPWVGNPFTLRVSIYCMGPHHCHVPAFSVFPSVSSVPCVGDPFTLRTLSPPPCIYIHCVGSNFLHGFPELSCTYNPCIHCMSSVPCMVLYN